DPGEVHLRRIPSGPLVLGDKEAEPLLHLAVQRLIKEFQPGIHQVHREDDTGLGLVPGSLGVRRQLLPDRCRVEDREQAGDRDCGEEDCKQKVDDGGREGRVERFATIYASTPFIIRYLPCGGANSLRKDICLAI
ncbi:MAG: hypothetical protein PWR25_1435, partial [Euryarchaeota archaeon]|nr:hypothetical protein [Euryarchaeota archaeon]